MKRVGSLGRACHHRCAPCPSLYLGFCLRKTHVLLLLYSFFPGMPRPSDVQVSCFSGGNTSCAVVVLRSRIGVFFDGYVVRCVWIGPSLPVGRQKFTATVVRTRGRTGCVVPQETGLCTDVLSVPPQKAGNQKTNRRACGRMLSLTLAQSGRR